MSQTDAKDTRRRNAPKGEGTSPKFGVRLPPATRAILTQRAKAAGLSKGALIRALIEGAPLVSGADQAAAQQTNAQLARIGNNLNQLARHANSTRGDPDAARLAGEVAAIRGERRRIFAAPARPEAR
ncbi:plasmid mobilization protein [Paracoccus yeei]|nr:plasmid mobilization relaxosome protein MobC [Paracoccus yeei]